MVLVLVKNHDENLQRMQSNLVHGCKSFESEHMQKGKALVEGNIYKI